MSALAMILTAAITVLGDGPKKVSGEMEHERQPLDLKGQWKAVAYWRGQVIKGEAALVDGEFRVKGRGNNQVHNIYFGKMVDEGRGNLRMGACLGIYEQDGSRLRICVGTLDDKSRPVSFHPVETKCLLILNRIESSK